MLLVIVVGAALAGWLLVRLTAPEPRIADAPPTVEEALPAPDTDTVVAAPDASAAAPDMDAPDAEGDEDAADVDVERILSDLRVLAQVVRKDKFIQDLAFPENTEILELPGLIQYVRAVEFFQPAFEQKEGDR